MIIIKKNIVELLASLTSTKGVRKGVSQTVLSDLDII